MEIKEFQHKNGVKLKVNPADLSLYINGHRFAPEGTVITVIFSVMTNSSFTSYAQIAESLSKKHGISVEDPAVISHKYVNKAREFLRKSGCSVALFENRRSAGYSLDPAWRPSQAVTAVPDDGIIQEIEISIEEALRCLEMTPIKQTASGLSYVQISPLLAVRAFERLNQIYWKIIDLAAHSGNALRIMPLREQFFKILTYLVFWRLGDSLTDEKWQSDYRIELNLLRKELINTYTQFIRNEEE